MINERDKLFDKESNDILGHMSSSNLFMGWE